MTPKEFAKSALWDFILCTLMAGALVTALSDGFNIEEALFQNHALVYGLCALLSALLVVTTYSKRAVLPGAGLFVVAAIGVLAWGAVSTTNANIFADEYGNTLVFATLLVCVCLAVFLLSRRPLVSCLLAVIGVFAIVTIQFLYVHEPYLEFAVFGIASVVNCLFRRYMRNLRASESVETAFSASIAVALVMCLVACGIGAGVWYGIVQPLNPPAKQLILITEYRSQPEETVIATTSFTELLNDLLSNQEAQDQQNTSNQDPQQEGDPEDEAQENDAKDGLAQSVASENNLFYEIVVRWWEVLIVLVLAVVALPIALRAWLRRRRYESLCALPPSLQAEAFGEFFMKRLGKMKIKKVPEDTLREFCVHAQSQLERFEEAEPGVSTTQTLAVVEAAVYGGVEPSEQDLHSLQHYYQVFYKRACAYVGRLKYVFYYWRM